jgi:hypothetical protein
MPPSLAPEIATPRLPPALRACGLALALSLPLLSACSSEPPGATEPAEKPAATSAASAPPPSVAPSPAEAPPTFMRIGSVTPAVGEAPAAPTAAAAATATAVAAAAADDGAPEPSATPQGNSERGSEAPPPPRGGKTAPAGGVPAKGGQVGAAGVVSTGTLSEDEVRAAIAQKQSDFRVCYDIGRGASSDFAGSVSLRVSIDAAGNVTAVEVTASTTRMTSVDVCVRDAMLKVPFPGKGSGTVVLFPIDFAR